MLDFDALARANVRGVPELTRSFVTQLAHLGRADCYMVRPQLPCAASDDSEPEPAIAVAARLEYGDPHPDHPHLVIEVSDSSLTKDRRSTTAIYAEAGVPEYWIVDVDGRAVEVHTDPHSGAYRSIVRHEAGELRPIELPDIGIRIAEILPR